MRAPRAALIALSVGCAVSLLSCGGDPPPPETVGFSGTLYQQRFVNTDPVIALSGANVFVTGSGGGTILSAVVTDAAGGFYAGGLAKNIPVDLLFEKSGYARSVFPSVTESRDSLVFGGQVFEAKVADANAIIQEYAAAAGLSTAALMTFDPTATTSTAGAMVRGRIVKVSADGTGYETFKGAHVEVRDSQGTSYRVFYRGDFPNNTDPGPIDPNAVSTGDDSRFVAFGVRAQGLSGLPFEAGRISITVTDTDGGLSTYTQETTAVIGGITELDFFTKP